MNWYHLRRPVEVQKGSAWLSQSSSFSISPLLTVTVSRAEKKLSPGGGPEEAFVQIKPPSNISGGFLLSTIGALLI